MHVQKTLKDEVALSQQGVQLTQKTTSSAPSTPLETSAVTSLYDVHQKSVSSSKNVVIAYYAPVDSEEHVHACYGDKKTHAHDDIDKVLFPKCQKQRDDDGEHSHI